MVRLNQKSWLRLNQRVGSWDRKSWGRIFMRQKVFLNEISLTLPLFFPTLTTFRPEILDSHARLGRPDMQRQCLFIVVSLGGVSILTSRNMSGHLGTSRDPAPAPASVPCWQHVSSCPQSWRHPTPSELARARMWRSLIPYYYVWHDLILEDTCVNSAISVHEQHTATHRVTVTPSTTTRCGVTVSHRNPLQEVSL